MATIPEAFAIAIQHLQGGRLHAAEQICQRIVEADRGNAEALHLLGIINAQAGNHRRADEYINLALALKPDWAEAQAHLGNVLTILGQPDKAVSAYQRALQLKPDFAAAHSNLGNLFKEQGKQDEAVACYRRALQLQPNFAEAHCNLGNVLREQGRLDEAVSHLEHALQLMPDFAIAHNNLGNAMREQGKLHEAVSHFQHALQLQPGFAVALNNLGNAFKDQGRHCEAVACYRQAMAREPDYAEAHCNLGSALSDQGKLDEAVVCYRRALELQPGYAEACCNLGNAFKDMGKLDEAIGCYRQALDMKPEYVEAHSNLLNTLHYRPGVTQIELAEAHAGFDRRHAAPLYRVAVSPTSGSQPKRSDSPARLRLGFVSPDLGAHPVGYFLVRVLENLGHDQIELICYSDRIVKDNLTHRLLKAATQWCDVIGLSHASLAEQIRSDRIDILFDLAGHTAHNRLLVFARKPAPIQVTWAGYAGTTGLAAMDYLLADRFQVPPQAEPGYRERVLRMPDGYVCYDPPAYASAVTPLPALDADALTFGCFNNPAKLNRHVIEIWARILRRLPRSRLVLKYKGMTAVSVVKWLVGEFSSHGIDAQRVTLHGYSPNAQLLAEYNAIDLALDPMPYSGGLTTCEALWMGVPVVTCPGETFASRHSLSHLSNVGVTETIARDPDEYVELAVSLASDLPRLAAIRSRLREQMAASPLCDGRRFATNFAALLRDVWEQHMRSAVLEFE